MHSITLLLCSVRPITNSDGVHLIHIDTNKRPELNLGMCVLTIRRPLLQDVNTKDSFL